MFLTFVLLWIISIVLIYANPKAPWARWVSLCLFLNGFGGVAVIFIDNIIPYFSKYNNEKINFYCLIGKGIADILQHYFATYALICFALYFTNFLGYRISKPARYILIISLSVPSFAMLILYPLKPEFTPNYKVLSSWVVLYTLAAIVILLISIHKEQNSNKKHQNIITAILACPAALSVMWTSYLSVAVGYHEVWYFNIWIIIFSFVAFVFFALRTGILGVRFKVERHNLDDTINTMVNGMSMLSHAIKNEASTINLCIDTIRLLEQVKPEADRKLTIIKDSCKNLTEFTNKINKFRNLEMDFEPNYIHSLVEKVIGQALPMVADKKINIVNSVEKKIILMIDDVHISEALRNIIINSIEAIEAEGDIIINSEFREDEFCLHITDSGIGIPKASLEKVLTPFFSTKKGSNNFGLGLSYCYKVMRSHYGNLVVNSRLNQGTKMSLIFPMKRVIKNEDCVSVKA